jgi:hypothetical protein
MTRWLADRRHDDVIWKYHDGVINLSSQQVARLFNHRVLCMATAVLLTRNIGYELQAAHEFQLRCKRIRSAPKLIFKQQPQAAYTPPVDG